MFLWSQLSGKVIFVQCAILFTYIYIYEEENMHRCTEDNHISLLMINRIKICLNICISIVVHLIQLWIYLKFVWIGIVCLNSLFSTCKKFNICSCIKAENKSTNIALRLTCTYMYTLQPFLRATCSCVFVAKTKFRNCRFALNYDFHFVGACRQTSDRRIQAKPVAQSPVLLDSAPSLPLPYSFFPPTSFLHSCHLDLPSLSLSHPRPRAENQCHDYC